MKPLYIFDLDGTLALIEHRRHFVERPSLKCYDCGGKNWKNCVQCSDLDAGFKPDWPGFFAACVDDKPNWPVIRLLDLLVLNNEDVWVFSGRSDEVLKPTQRWLSINTALSSHELVAPKSGAHYGLRMRPKGDYTPDDVLKKQWLDEMHPDDRGRIEMVFDDRDRVVKMWRDAGLVCCQVASGDF